VFARKTYGVIAEICESISFIFIGVAVFVFDATFDFFDIEMLAYAIFVILVARAAHVLTCSFFINLTRKTNKVSPKFQFILWFSGFRGAMAFALAIESIFLMPDKDTHHISSRIFSLAIWISVVTILLQSPFIEPIVVYMGLIEKPGPGESNREINLEDEPPLLTRNPTSFDNLKRNISEIMKGVFTKDQQKENPNNISSRQLATGIMPDDIDKDGRGSTSREDEQVAAEILQTDSSNWDNNPDKPNDSEAIEVSKREET
jgi:hypothetical protein